MEAFLILRRSEVQSAMHQNGYIKQNECLTLISAMMAERFKVSYLDVETAPAAFHIFAYEGDRRQI